VTEVENDISSLLALFRLPTAAQEMVPRVRAAGHGEALPVIAEVLRTEAGDRHTRRVDRLRKMSRLPPGKTLTELDLTRFPLGLQQQLRELCTGAFLDNAVNVLAFGLPGTGKTHGGCAIGEALVRAGRSVLFAPAYRLVQDLLAAKRDLALPAALRKLDAFELLILWTTSGTSSSARTRSRCCSPSSPSGTSAGPS
jgi:DNA replication protein DnaC